VDRSPLRLGGLYRQLPRYGGTDYLLDAVGLPGLQYIQGSDGLRTRTYHSGMDTLNRLHASDLEQAAVVKAIFLYNTSDRDAMMPGNRFPTQNHQTPNGKSHTLASRYVAG